MLEELAHLARVQGNAAKEKNWIDPEDYQDFKNHCSTVRDLIKKSLLNKPWNEAELQAAARRGLDLLELAADIARCYEAAKQELNVLEFDDLMAKVHRLLTAPEYAQLQRSLAQSTQLLLVDEFQDTDPMQVAIVKALRGPHWAEAGLFVVGDAKQSIYRFRGAKPEVSRRLSEELAEGGRLSLTTNFRSQGAILDFVNALFCDTFEDYQPLRAIRPQLTPPPAIEFLWVPGDPESFADDSTIPGRLTGNQRSRYREARYVAQRLVELIDGGAPVVVDEDSKQLRAIRQGDIAILLRSLNDVQLYEEALREQGLDYYLAGGHAFYAQQEIYDVLHLLRAVCSLADELSLAGALRSPLFSLEDETLLWLVQKCSSLQQALNAQRWPAELSPAEQAKVARAARVIEQLRREKDRLLVADLLTLAIELTGYDAVLLSEFLGERKLANLHKLVEQARTLDRLNPGDLNGFVTQLTEFVARAPKEPVAATTAEGDVIRIMTIHNAKGLEFPVVVLPDLERKRPNSHRVPIFDEQLGPLVPASDDSCVGWNLHQRTEMDEEQAERLRLLYVATTRAADYLLMASSMKDRSKPQSHWLKFLAERFDLETGTASHSFPPISGFPRFL